MRNDLGEVRTKEYAIADDVDYLYDVLCPFIHSILSSYYIFNYFAKTIIEFDDEFGYSELVFDTLEELRMYYINII